MTGRERLVFVMLDNGSASARTMGAFLSQLIVEHRQRVQRAQIAAPPTVEEIAQKLRWLADLLTTPEHDEAEHRGTSSAQ
jgi:hypothetical protein